MTTPPLPLEADAVRAVTRAVRAALSVEGGFEPDYRFGPIDYETPDFIRAARVHRVASLLSENADAIGMPQSIRDQLHRTAVYQAESALKLTFETTRAYRAMTDAGIPALVMKGIPLSVLTTGTLTARGGGDVDLLVPVDYVARAHKGLELAGWTSLRGGTPRPGATWRLISWVNRELPFEGPNSAADLHWRVDYDHHLFADPKTLIGRATTVDVGGHPVRTLSPSDALAACCLHIYIDRCSQLRGLVDLVRLARVTGVSLPSGASPMVRNLTSDIIRFTGERVGNIRPGQMNALSVPPRVDTRYLHELWAENSTLALHTEQPAHPLHRFGELYRHQNRYASSIPAGIGRFTANYTLDWASLDPALGVANIGQSAIDKIRAFGRHRLLRKE